MKNFKFIILSAFLISFSSLHAFSTSNQISQEALKKRMIGNLESMKHIFEVKYAPSMWKLKAKGWDLETEFLKTKTEIEKLKNPTIKEYQVILRKFFQATKDYHVGITFFSTEKATLPFSIKGAQERYFISFVQSGKIQLKPPLISAALEVGDEVLLFNGVKINDALLEFKKKEFGDNKFETDLALAEVVFTARAGSAGHLIPQGNVDLQVKKKKTGKIEKYSFKWDYQPEKILDFTKSGLPILPPVPKALCDLSEKISFDQTGDFFNKVMCYPLWDINTVSAEEVNPHLLGAKRSFVPPLGKKIWSTDASSHFDAYIFKNEKGKQIGYIRIPHYAAGAEEAEEWGELMTLFEERTEALVIDQVNNPGGSLFYLYALASMLTDKSLDTPKHHLLLTQQEIYTVANLLPQLEAITDDELARIALGKTWVGYHVDLKMVKLLRQFCQLLMSEWSQGHFYTTPTHMFGVDNIDPDPDHRYTKPILVLINQLDFSGGDFFPAILQDNNRATLFGSSTAGAGGYVMGCNFQNLMGINGFCVTASFAERKGEKPIENLGVTPDILYNVSPRDLQENYVEYVSQVLKAVNNLVEPKTKI